MFPFCVRIDAMLSFYRPSLLIQEYFNACSLYQMIYIHAIEEIFYWSVIGIKYAYYQWNNNWACFFKYIYLMYWAMMYWVWWESKKRWKFHETSSVFLLRIYVILRKIRPRLFLYSDYKLEKNLCFADLQRNIKSV